jgi:hypothetical protein
MAEIRSLADDVRARDDDELLALFRARPDLAQPFPHSFADLLDRITSTTSVHRVLAGLDTRHRRVLEAMAIQGEAAVIDRAAAALGLEPADVEPAVAHLHERALLWRARDAPDGWRLPAQVRAALGPWPAGLGPSVAQVMCRRPTSELMALLEMLRCPAAGDPALDRAALAARLGEPEVVEGLVASVSEAAREALSLLVPGPPVGTTTRALAVVPAAEARTPLEELLARGLVLPWQDRDVVVPAEVALVLRGGTMYPPQELDPPAPAGPLVDPSHAERSALGAVAEVMRLVETLVRHLEAQPVTELRAGGMPVRDFRRLAGELDVSEHELRTLLHVADAAGLIGVSDRWLPTAAYDRWRNDSGGRRWVVLAEAWLASPFVSGSRSQAAAGTSGESDGTTAPVVTTSSEREPPALAPQRVARGLPRLRRHVLELLPVLPTSPSGHRSSRSLGSAVPSVSLSDVVAADAWRRPALSGRARGRSVSEVVAEAQWLGIAAVGILAPWSAAVLASEVEKAAALLEDALPPPVEEVVLQGDLTAVAPGPLRPEVADRLAAIADTESTGGAAVYRFTTASIRRGLDAGLSSTEVVHFLESVSATAVPQPLRYLVADVARRHGALRVAAVATVVRAEDAAELATILADPQLRPLGLRSVAETVAVTSLPPEEVVTALRAADHSPVAETESGAIARSAGPPRATPSSSGTTRRRGAGMDSAGGGRGSAVPDAGDSLVIGDDAEVLRLVRALRRTDAAAADATPVAAPVTSSTDLVQRLRQAGQDGEALWIGYTDERGTRSTRLVRPISLRPGLVVAHDERKGAVRSFALHRITSVGTVDK